MVVYTLAIVGAGPRGLSVLERVVALHPPGRALLVELIDPAPCGPGAHPLDQPDYLLANTVAGQVTAFRHDDPAATPGGPAGPSLADWVGCARDTYVPRRRMGQYFAFAAESLRSRAPREVTVRVRRARAERLVRTVRGWDVRLDDGAVVGAHFAVLASGHGQNRLTPDEARLAAFADDARAAGRPTAYLPRPSPLRDLDAISPGARVAVRGMGLSAIDVVLALTVGRGGRFVQTGSGVLEYRPSGAEPRIGVYSRHGRAFWPRARNQKAPGDVYRPERMTVDRLRTMRAAGPIDFARDVIPLLEHEVRAASARVRAGADLGAILAPLGDPSVAPAAAAQLQERLIAFYEIDEARAAAGNLTDAVKAGADAIRDLRNEIRTAVEHGGLSARSHREFVEVYAPLLHVLSAGPPRVRARQWRALFAAGTLRVLPSPATLRADPERGSFVLESSRQAAVSIDVVVGGAADPFLPDRDRSPLVRGLLADGAARAYRNDGYHPGGFDIDTGGHLVAADGSVHPDLVAVGNPTEGPHYFTNMLPAPGLPSRITADAETVVRSMLARPARPAAVMPIRHERRDLVG